MTVACGDAKQGKDGRKQSAADQPRVANDREHADRLAELEAMIASGRYTIDFDRLARKLLDSGAVDEA